MHVRGTQVGVIADALRWSAPHVPVDAARQLLRLEVISLGRITHADLDALDGSDATVAHALDRLHEALVELAALLTASLERDLRAIDGLRDRLALAHRERERLLAIDVLLRAGGRERRQHVPM